MTNDEDSCREAEACWELKSQLLLRTSEGQPPKSWHFTSSLQVELSFGAETEVQCVGTSRGQDMKHKTNKASAVWRRITCSFKHQQWRCYVLAALILMLTQGLSSFNCLVLKMQKAVTLCCPRCLKSIKWNHLDHHFVLWTLGSMQNAEGSTRCYSAPLTHMLLFLF